MLCENCSTCSRGRCVNALLQLGWRSAVLLKTVTPPGPRTEDKLTRQVSPKAVGTISGLTAVNVNIAGASVSPCMPVAHGGALVEDGGEGGRKGGSRKEHHGK